jgi:hypothetical protein
LKYIGLVDVDRIHVAEDTSKKQAVMLMVINLEVPKNAEILPS